ncbi:MAG TPA: YhjD/YihY/BrkB family envelope integrity protein [Oligoflexia bacterium]|nr:YhjD/YihY/BrkB family envelope integrity protein [Oligoflexia bacterium]HMP27639.1 YhjD/YihY/BrkB family envelope integrity protein [Oligoflexia bacterium]
MNAQDNFTAQIQLGVWERIKWWVRVVISGIDRFYWDNGFSKAAALAYSTLLSLVPVMALSYGLLASFVSRSESIPELRDFIIHVFKQFTPSTAAVDTVLNYLSNSSAIITGLNELAFIFLVITAILLLNSVENTLNEVWQVFEARPLWHRITRFCTIIVIAPALALSGYYTSTRISLFDEVTWIAHFSSLAVPYLVDFTAFVLLYYMIPKAPVKLVPAIFGALFSALLFGIAKDLFAIFVVKFSAHAAIYGTIAAVPIFLIWLYCAWSIVLLGAEISWQAQYLPRSGKIWKYTLLSSGDGRLLLAVQVLILVARSYLAGRRAPNDLELAESLRCSSAVLKPIIESLIKDKIIARADSREMQIALLKDPSQIDLSALADQLLINGGGNGKAAPAHQSVAVKYSKELSRLFDWLASKPSNSLTLQEIL